MLGYEVYILFHFPECYYWRWEMESPMERDCNEYTQKLLLWQITNNAVLAVPAGELGDVRVETLLATLTTCSEDELMKCFKLRVLDFGELTLSSILLR